MSQKIKQIARILEGFNKNVIPVFEAVVTSEVDEEYLTIEVEPTGQAPLTDVRLKAAIDNISHGVVEYPKKGSTVLCGVIGNDEDICFVLKTSEVEKITVNQEVIFNEGEHGGLCITPELVTQLNKMSARIDGVIDAITNAVAGVQDGGLGLHSTIKASLATLVDVENFDKIENETVKH